MSDRALAQSPGEVRAFSIPEQPLPEALAQFATVSGVDVAYRQSLAAGRRSHAVTGEHPAPVALQSLLRNTGLAVRFTGPKAAIIYQPGEIQVAAAGPGDIAPSRSLRLSLAEVRAPVMVGAQDRSGHRRYAMSVRDEVGDVLRRDGAYRGRAFRLEIQLDIDPQGVIRSAAIRRASGEPDWDRYVVTTLTGRALAAAPPDDLTDPLLFEIASDRLAGRPGRRGARP